MKNKIVEILNDVLTAEHTYDGYGRNDFVDGIDQAAQAIIDQLGLGWISIDERLPEVKDYWSKTYLVAYKVIDCDYRGLIATARYFVRDANGDNTGWEFTGGRKAAALGYEIIAYRPLPQPPDVPND